jgi:3-oxoacyl-[acyl-carrier-protein] synthase II
VRPVFVRGVGAVSALGRWPATAAALADGAVSVGPVDFDAGGFPCPVASVVREALPEGADRRIQLALAAVDDAWAAADVPADRIGVFVGAESGLARFEAAHQLSRAAGGGSHFEEAAFAEAAFTWADPARTSPAAVAWAVAGRVGAAGPNRTISSACASGLSALIEGARAIRAGACDLAVCGGVGADVDPLTLAGFGRLGALSERGVAAPFDRQRDGFVLGEGAAFLVLAAERGDAVVEVAGAGRTLDGHHITAPDPDGAGARRAMAAALDEAGRPAIGYLQAHGTATVVGDAVEARALREVVRLDDALVGAVKGALGHWIAGAGALGALCAAEAVASGLCLPTANLIEPESELPHLVGRAIRRPVDAALVSSFGFGGTNASMVLRRCG